ncbi:hypothetical protein Echvi_0860 [Echinicola vietnamensis DSM 17526]|uniref:Uncharacterized protein n=1 Tax=Echinicola vietnamensis (strain DSM 17526 / LMG 23754 / KMM 6221) TaxID=926556 RepID=L0FVT6_ECHVK|nr:hypothetical protein Echvi_0860 [Echinicola vietnamensis DSM 17526]
MIPPQGNIMRLGLEGSLDSAQETWSFLGIGLG